MGFFAGIVQYLPDLCACFRYSVVSDIQIINSKVNVRNIYMKKVKNNRESTKVREGGGGEGAPWHQNRYSRSLWRTHHGGNFFLRNCSLLKNPLQRIEKCEREGAANHNHNPPSPVHLCHSVWVRGVRNEGIKLGMGKGGWGATMLVQCLCLFLTTRIYFNWE